MNRVVAALACGALGLGCVREPAASPEHVAPAHVEHPTDEGELTRVILSASAVDRLGIETAQVQEGPVPVTIEAPAEIIAVPGSTLLIAAPIGCQIRALVDRRPGTHVDAGDVLASVTPLAPAARDTKAVANREVAAAEADLTAAQARLQRALDLAAGRAGSQRAVEEARATGETAQANLDAAKARARTTRATPLLADVTMTVRAPASGVLRSVSIAQGQSVAAGSPMFEIVDVDALWVRVGVYAGDLARLQPGAPADVSGLGPTGAWERAEPVSGPPTATPAANSVDRYYSLSAAPSSFALGERVLVSLRVAADQRARHIPATAIVHDAGGTAWIYQCDSETSFRRVPVDVVRTVADRAVLGHGPAVGACVVSVGAAELFGTEFEPGH